MLRAVLAALALACSFGAHAGPLDRDFQKLEQQLRLSPVQKEQFDMAVAATQRAFLAVAMAGMQTQDAQQVIDQVRPLLRDTRDEWSRLYAMLDEDQVRIARRYIEERLTPLLR